MWRDEEEKCWAFCSTGKLPINIMECTLSDSEKEYVIKFTKLAFLEQDTMHRRAEYLCHELWVKYDIKWDCVVGQDLRVSKKDHREQYIHFTFGGETCMMAKNDSATDLPEFVIETDMDDVQKKYALEIAKLAFLEKKNDLDRADYIGKEFDSKYGLDWQCVVGRTFDYAFNYNKYIRFCIGLKMVYLFRVKDCKKV